MTDSFLNSFLQKEFPQVLSRPGEEENQLELVDD